MGQNEISRPDKVRQALLLLYVTLGLGVLRVVVAMAQDLHGMNVAPIILLRPFATIGAMALVIYMIAKGKNWARITFLAVVILDVFFTGFSLLTPIPVPPIPFLLGVALLVVRVVALVFLFQKPSADWFRQMKANN